MVKEEIILEEMRHTAAHILAAASTKLKPDTKLGVGPAIENGFYHDIDVAERYTEADLAALQAEMEKIKKMDLPMTQREVSKDEARSIFDKDPYKLELIDELPGEMVGISDMGDGFFMTLCKGGHVSSTGKVGHFQLTRMSGVYWKGDATKPQLQRIYGILFATKQELKEHVMQLEEAKKRDHRKLGKELDLFAFSPLVGAGLPLFTPRGTIIRQELERFLQSIQKPLGYQPVTIPHITKPELYKMSGHWDKFQENLFHVTSHSDEQFVIKPMNCPHHTQIFASRPRSYKDLPLRYSEVTAVYRDEKAGELGGLTRVRSITQDDAHIFCREDQIEAEVTLVLNIIQKFYEVFDFKLQATLSLRDPQNKEAYLGSDEIWDRAENTLRSLLQKMNMSPNEFPGEAAFYGPKVDFIATDSIGRKWQLATAQLDFNMPGRFNLSYTDAEGKEQTPIIIHQAIMGSLERFMAVLIEHYAGAFPVWLAPLQVAVLPISDDQSDYARQVAEALQTAGVRAEVDGRSESIGKKIREQEKQKVPVMIVVGKEEVSNTSVSVRRRGNRDQQHMSQEEFVAAITKEISERR